MIRSLDYNMAMYEFENNGIACNPFLVLDVKYELFQQAPSLSNQHSHSHIWYYTWKVKQESNIQRNRVKLIWFVTITETPSRWEMADAAEMRGPRRVD